MTNIFVNGNELTSKQEFDSKVNISDPLYQLTDSSKEIPRPKFFKTQSDSNNGFLSIVHQRIEQSTNGTLGNYDNLLWFGGDDIRSLIDVGHVNHQVRIFSGNSTANWQDDLVLKSDYDKLVARVSALENRIGGGLSKLLAHLKSHLIRKVAF